MWPCRLFVPAVPAGHALPLVLMLHGCRQGPDDFAAITRLEALAEEQGLVVAWPGQSTDRNRSKCWNWFEPAHQSRGRGEPSLLVDLVAAVIRQAPVDTAQVFAAGFSAGAAMAVLLGQAYPDVFAGVAAHSGLPAGAAFGPASALAAMKSGRAGGWAPRKPQPVRTVAFHGTADTLVSPVNSAAIVNDALAAFERQGGPLAPDVAQVEVPGHRASVVTRHLRDGAVMVEHWAIADGPHAWAGGRAGSRFSDARGPDVSAEMVRFLLQR